MPKLAASRDARGPAAYSIRDAAAIASRSSSWIRTMRAYGPLELAELGGRQAVTADSLFALLAAIAEKRAAAATARSPFAGFPRLAFTHPDK